ncbi:MAG: hypothetical protein HY681_09035 [Chloroflexi bacterium]|nr:hypothetical protein [Chloroflexota bacterium]
MSPSEWFLLIIRWLHLLGAVAWVGGSILFLTVLRPALSGNPQAAAVSRLAGQEFRNLVDVAITVLLVTGVILSIVRLTSGHATVAYGVVLGIKIALAVWMFYLVWFRERRRPSTSGPTGASPFRAPARLSAVLTANNLLLFLGVAVLFLADLLRALFENALLR